MIFITGPHCAGKTEISKFLEKFNYLSFDLGPILREIYGDSECNLEFEEWCKKNELEHDQYFTDKMIVEYISDSLSNCKNSEIQDILIVGSRSIKGIRYIEKNINSNSKQSKIIYIHAPTKTLRERFCKREMKEVSIEEFKNLLNKDLVLGLGTIKNHANYAINNNGSKEKFKQELYDYLISDEDEKT